jgi:hypothetical protein
MPKGPVIDGDFRGPSDLRVSVHYRFDGGHVEIARGSAAGSFLVARSARLTPAAGSPIAL